MTTQTNDYLVGQLEAREAELEKLRNQLQEIEIRDADATEKANYEDGWRWRHIRCLKSSELSDEDVEDTNFGLPVPRLEIRIRRISDYNTIVDYGLVSQHLCEQIHFIPIGSTQVGGSDNFPPGWSKTAIEGRKLMLPFRDGAHISHDARQLNLPAYVVNLDWKMYRKLERPDPDAKYFRDPLPGEAVYVEQPKETE